MNKIKYFLKKRRIKKHFKELSEEQLKANVKKARRGEMSEWISVKDRLPESDSFCRVKLKNNEKIFDSHFYEDSYGKWWSSVKNIYDRNYTTRVTHWIPLPKD